MDDFQLAPERVRQDIPREKELDFPEGQNAWVGSYTHVLLVYLINLINSGLLGENDFLTLCLILVTILKLF